MMDQINWDCLQRMYDAKLKSWYVRYSEGEWVVGFETPSGGKDIFTASALERAVGKVFENTASG